MIRLKHILAESITVDAVTFTPQRATGGPIIVQYRGYEHVYHVTIDTALYDGPLAVTKMWESERNPGTYILRDNAGHQETLPAEAMRDLALQLKKWPESVTHKSWKIDIKLTKHHDKA